MKQLAESLSFKTFAASWSLLVFALIIVRSIEVPISHDEAATFLHYIQQGDFFPFYAHWDANNHSLNSLLSILTYETLGAELVWLRLPNVLSFSLFAIFGYRIISNIRSNLVRISSFIAITTAWMPFEFFAQFRGYGLGLAFLMAGIFYLIAFSKNGKVQTQIAIWASLTLALFANLSLNNTYLLCLILVLLLFIFHSGKRSWKNILSYVLFGLVPFSWFSYVSFTMKEKGLLYYGEGTGFIEVTVKTLSAHTFGVENPWFLYFLSVLGSLAIAIILIERSWIKTLIPRWDQLIALLLLGNVVGSVLLHFLLGVNYPEDRVGIYFIPLFILVLAAASDLLLIHKKSIEAYLGAALLLTFPIITAANSRLHQVHVWRQIPLDRVLYKEVVQRSNTVERPPMVSGYKLFPLSWAYENLKSSNPLPPLIPQEFDNGVADFHICYCDDCDSISEYYTDITPQDNLEVRLFERTEKIRFDTLITSTLEEYKGAAEFVNLQETRDLDYLSQVDAVHLDFRINSELDPCTINLVITAQDENEGLLYYDYIPLHWVRDQWLGERFSVTRPVAFGGNEKRLICYLWNRNKERMEILDSKVSLLYAK